MEDIETDHDCFMSFCVKFKYLGSYFVPELNDTADITERISQARKLFGSMSIILTLKNYNSHPYESSPHVATEWQCNPINGGCFKSFTERKEPFVRSFTIIAFSYHD
jgi:hypothetical protein